ncbi:MAG: hypothetical protein ACO3I0_01915 [Limisphaerales bacterium]
MASVLWGASGLATVSLAAYSVWAFLRNPPGGELGLYALIAAVYLGGSGLVLSGLLHGARRGVRFYQFFLPAFLLYAVGWTAAWFGLGGKAGEWGGSLLGTQLFAWVVWRFLRRPPGFWGPALVLFVTHSAGYFAGGFVFTGLLRSGVPGWTPETVLTVAKLSWGFFHGLGFGAGLGGILAAWQRPDGGRELTP